MAGRTAKPERVNKGFEIEGCYVEFPFEPYDCQVSRMDQEHVAVSAG